MKKKSTFNRIEIENIRAQTFQRVVSGEISLKDAAQLTQLSHSQAHRLLVRFEAEGLDGLAHGLRGKPSNRAFDQQTKQAILKLYRDRFPDFGPTLATEKLEHHGYYVDHETLRLWLIEEGLWEKDRKRQAHRSWRERGRVIASCSLRRTRADGRIIPSLV